MFGYRYADKLNVKPTYEFGYGLSYTTFSITDLKLSGEILNKSITVSAKVKNTGKVPGKQVVQIYISAPSKTIDKPSQELKAFSKSKLLQPGQSQIFTFKIAAADIASFHTKGSQWITDAGQYTVKAGASSRDIKQSASFNVPKSMIIETDHSVLQPPIDIVEIHPN